MKRYIHFIILGCIILFSCKKDGFITSPNANLIVAGGLDTLRFDTVFTSIGSITQSFTIVNDNSEKLRLSKVELKGGENSPFKINVNGVAGNNFSNIEINKNDSIYVFVKLTIDPTQNNQPFVVNDSLEITYNGTVSKLHLQAFGQNARFLKDWRITKDTVWDNQLPYVLLNPLVVHEGARLTIEKGARIYSSANAAFIVNGTLRAIGGKEEADRIIFRGSRLDEAYKDLPGTWGGIVFNPTSSFNTMEYTHVLNAYQAITVLNGPTLTMNQCIIDNAYDIGLQGINSSIRATNCLISQCGNDGLLGVGGNNLLLIAGNYTFNHCTIVTYANLYQSHKQPAVYLSNTDGVTAAPLTATFNNTIIYGDGGLAENEIVTNKGAADFNVSFSQVLYKVKTDPTDIKFTNSIKNAAPLFDTINTSRRTYNFRLRPESPAVNQGKASLPAITIDLDGKPRNVGGAPDMGCYETQ